MDDDASVVESYGGYNVEPFGGDPLDEELLKVAEALYASGAAFYDHKQDTRAGVPRE